MKKNTLYYGDCLEVMKDWPAACVDLIYLDPPFNSNVNYNILFGNQKNKTRKVQRKDLAQITAFTDTWEWSEKTAARISEIKKAHGHRARNAVIALDSFYRSGTGMLTYLVYMADRINAMYPLLKDTGSLYLHCDMTASHYLKMILDDVFGAKNFKNEIVWHYFKPHSSKTNYPKNYDSLFFYAKSKAYRFNHEAALFDYDEKSVKRYDKTDKQGKKYKTYFGKDGVERTAYLKGGKSENVFKIPFVQGTSKERLGYPTQKPLALLTRIVEASSIPGDVVLDPFCGCGTTVEAAMNLQRDFIGIDISMYALDVIQTERLKNVKFAIEGVPTDIQTADNMARNRPFAFEKWAVHLIPGFVTNNKQTGDGGIDGWAGLLHPPAGEDGVCVAQVKGGAPNVDSLKALLSQITGGYASVGVFITLKKWDTPTVRKCVANAGVLQQGAASFNRMVVWSVEERFAGVEVKLPPLANPRTGKPLQDDLLARK